MNERVSTNYVIKGGEVGRTRLALMARVLASTTGSLLQHFEPLRGGFAIDAGCGGGDVAFDLARRVGPEGRVVGLDLDDVKLSIARDEARHRGLHNTEFRTQNVCEPWSANGASLIYSRFVLTHLPRPAEMLAHAYATLAPNGSLVLEDIDFAGTFCDPPCPAFEHARELYIQASMRRGGSPFIGRTLVRLLESAGFTVSQAALVQPMGRHNDLKQIFLLTFSAIEDVLHADSLATEEDTTRITSELSRFLERPDSTVGWPRVFQAGGTKRVP